MARLTELIIAPSILSADFARLAEHMAEAKAGGTNFFHIDVMDGHFVENITIGPPVLESLRNRFDDLIFDSHLMIENPERYVEDFAKACIRGDKERGRHYLTVHAEACPHLHRAIEVIRKHGLRPGVSLNPGTPLAAVREVLPMLDLLLIMSVDPGFGGQGFLDFVLPKVVQARHLLSELEGDALLMVDGGIKAHNIAVVAACGATAFVAGSEVFGAPSPQAKVQELRKALEGINPYTPLSPEEAKKKAK
jgi:ribulose-phosphate 3-epimerase